MYQCEGWTIKKAEHQRIYGLELWWSRILLRVPWTARRSNQSILKEISPENSSEGLMLKLKLQYFGHLMWGADSLEKTLMLRKIEGRRRREKQRMRWLYGITDLMDMSLSKLWVLVLDRGGLVCCSAGVTKSQTQLSDWTELYWWDVPMMLWCHWCQVVSARNGLESGLDFKLETEAGSGGWKHQIVATRPVISDKGPDPLALQGRISSSEASNMFIKRKKTTACVARHGQTRRESPHVAELRHSGWLTFIGHFFQFSFGQSFWFAWPTVHIWYISESFHVYAYIS